MSDSPLQREVKAQELATIAATKAKVAQALLALDRATTPGPGLAAIGERAVAASEAERLREHMLKLERREQALLDELFPKVTYTLPHPAWEPELTKGMSPKLQEMEAGFMKSLADHVDREAMQVAAMPPVVMPAIWGKKLAEKFYKESDFAKITGTPMRSWTDEIKEAKEDKKDHDFAMDASRYICIGAGGGGVGSVGGDGTFTTAPRRLTPEESAELKTLKAKKDLGPIGIKELAWLQELSRIESEGPTPSGVEACKSYGTRLYPRETRAAIQMLQGQPSALTLLFAMTTCVGFGCVLNADRKKLLEITGFSISTYTRALNVLLGLGLVLPNLIGDIAPQAGFVQDKELPARKNGRRYKIAPFIAFRGPKEFHDHEVRKYNNYMAVRLASKITPVQDDGDGNPEFVTPEENP